MTDQGISYDDDDGGDWHMNRLERSFFVVTRITAAVSLFFSAALFLETAVDVQTAAPTKAVSRIIGIWQVGHVLIAASYIWNVTAAPQHYDPYPYYYGDVPGARGTIRTCELQGFLLQLGEGLVVLWDTILSLTFLCIVRYNWSNAALDQFHRTAHCIIWPLAAALAITPWPLEMYNYDWGVCWIQSYPFWCKDSSDCIRGPHAWKYQTAFFAMVCVALLVSTYCMMAIFCTIRHQEERNTRYASHSVITSINHSHTATNSSGSNHNIHMARSLSIESRADHSRSRSVGIQGLMYTCTLLVAYIPLALDITLYSLSDSYGHKVWNDWFTLAAGVSLTMHSVLYWMIFARTRDTMHTAYGRTLQWTVSFLPWILCCGWWYCRQDGSNNRRDGSTTTLISSSSCIPCRGRNKNGGRTTTTTASPDNPNHPPPSDEDLEQARKDGGTTSHSE